VCSAAVDLHAALVIFQPRHTPYEEVRKTRRVCEPVVHGRTSWRSESPQRQSGRWQDPTDREHTRTNRQHPFGCLEHEHAISP
jgi:hypothetical protein